MPTTEKLVDPKIVKEAEKKDSNKKTEEIVNNFTLNPFSLVWLIIFFLILEL